MDDIPCENCVTFIMCRNRIVDLFPVLHPHHRLRLYDLYKKCGMFRDYCLSNCYRQHIKIIDEVIIIDPTSILYEKLYGLFIGFHTIERMEYFKEIKYGGTDVLLGM